MTMVVGLAMVLLSGGRPSAAAEGDPSPVTSRSISTPPPPL